MAAMFTICDVSYFFVQAIVFKLYLVSCVMKQIVKISHDSFLKKCTNKKYFEIVFNEIMF